MYPNCKLARRKSGYKTQIRPETELDRSWKEIISRPSRKWINGTFPSRKESQMERVRENLARLNGQDSGWNNISEVMNKHAAVAQMVEAGT